jgi:hypothetical protein
VSPSWGGGGGGAPRENVQYIKVLKYHQTFQITTEISGQFCPAIDNIRAIPVCYQLPLCFLAHKRIPRNVEKKYFRGFSKEEKLGTLRQTLLISAVHCEGLIRSLRS